MLIKGLIVLIGGYIVIMEKDIWIMYDLYLEKFVIVVIIGLIIL